MHFSIIQKPKFSLTIGRRLNGSNVYWNSGNDSGASVRTPTQPIHDCHRRRVCTEPRRVGNRLTLAFGAEPHFLTTDPYPHVEVGTDANSKVT